MMIGSRFWIFTKLGLRYILLMSSISLWGCVAVIPKELVREVDRSISFQELKESPVIYQEKLVVLGGTILEAKNTKQGTVLEILQKPLDRYDRPKNVDESAGRFLALYKGYLDTAIYRSGRMLTIVGKVLGTKTRPMGEIEYTYPYLEVSSIFLWKETYYEERPAVIYYGRRPYWWYYPYYP